MRLFECLSCGQRLYFENIRCESCGHALGYLPELHVLSALTPAEDGTWMPQADPDRHYRYCNNQHYGACNWLVPADPGNGFCRACVLNRTIPNLDDPRGLELWQRLEVAKHRLIYSLLRFAFPIAAWSDDPETGLAFDFLSDERAEFREDKKRVMTGHNEGVITINVVEADDAERERQRATMAEPYRTLLGHFRHESGHYYWERLVRAGSRIDEFRMLFGDESIDYGEALKTYYAGNRVADWSTRFVSAYASAHPWEDWAETWSHYLHIVDTLETAYAFGLRVTPRVGTGASQAMEVSLDPYAQADFDQLLAAWWPLTFAVNSLNRSMGHPDLYPFVISEPACNKLRFVHDVVQAERAQTTLSG